MSGGKAYAHKLMQAKVPTTAIRLIGIIHDFVMPNSIADTPAARGAIEHVSHALEEAPSH
jgi:acetyl esterase